MKKTLAILMLLVVCSDASAIGGRLALRFAMRPMLLVRVHR